MKKLFILVFSLLSATSYSQDKYNYTYFDKMVSIDGTNYVLATIENHGKMLEVKKEYLLFIDTKTGQTTRVEFNDGGYYRNVEQIKIDALGINELLVSARTVDLNGKNGIDWQDPEQLFVLSTDGKEKTLLTDSKLFVQRWVVNKTTGTIVITGHYDTNNNGKYDKTDKDEIGIYDLKTLKLVSKI